MRILFLSRWFPYPASNGSKLRIFHLLRGLARQHDVDLLTFIDEPEGLLDAGPLLQICGEIKMVPWRGFNGQSRRARWGYLNVTPRYYLETFSLEMQGEIHRALAQKTYDLVIASQVDMAAYGDCLDGIPAIFEEVEVGTLYGQYCHAPSLKQQLRTGLTWHKHRRYLKTLMQNYAACTVVSEPERALFAQALYGKNKRVPDSTNAIMAGMEMASTEMAGMEMARTDAVVIPNGVDVASYAQHRLLPQTGRLVFTGSFTYAPNYEAMCWFVGRVLPLVQAVLPNVQLYSTGSHSGYALPDVPNVHLTGFVEDIRPLVASAWVSLAPLHTGGGTRLKILEAMALGTPVVATTKGAEGLDVEPGKHLLIADTPADFAQAVLRLLQSEALRQELAQNAYALVQNRYDWGVIVPRFLELVEKVAHHE